MPLKQLSEAEISSWSRSQKDRWWFENLYRGDVPQLTLRSAATGFILGGILSATALYIGAKTGISIGVGLTSVILAPVITAVLLLLIPGNFRVVLRLAAILGSACTAWTASAWPASKPNPSRPWAWASPSTTA